MELILVPVVVGLLTAAIVVSWRIGLLSVGALTSVQKVRAATSVVTPVVSRLAQAAERRAATTTHRGAAAIARAIHHQCRPGRAPATELSWVRKSNLGWVGKSIGHPLEPALIPCERCEHLNAVGMVLCARCHSPLGPLARDAHGRRRGYSRPPKRRHGPGGGKR